MQRYSTKNPITHAHNQLYSQVPRPNKCKNVVDGLVHVCADGHSHASPAEVDKCIDAHMVFVCATNHMHTEMCGSERCDQIRREEEIFKDKELARQHEREMMDKQIKLVENLRYIGWNVKTQGMPALDWTYDNGDYQKRKGCKH